ncbi:MAG: glycosyltransferase family 4 protein [candidate division Zixibacteria bacterium]|nr:glycosyltransferase family 4 protein [candidate division Zixibacteria bacterium]
MTRILAVNWQDLKHPDSGGAEVHLEEILRRLAKKGHEIDLLCCNFPGGKSEEIVEGVNVIRRGSRSFFNWIAPNAIRKLVRQNKYDVVFEDINKIPFYSPLYCKMPLLVIIPHLFSNSIFKEINFLLGTYIYLAEKPYSFIYKRNHTMVISDSTAEEIIAKGIAKEQVHVVECGIDSDSYSFDPTIKKFEQPTILYVGRIKKYKSVETCIESMPKILQRVPEARLVIIGDGDHLPHLRKLTEKLKLSEKVEFLGFVPHEVKIEYLRRAHLSTYPSLKEGWGLTNIEANACGTAVLASRVPGLRDSVDEGKSGLLFEYGNLEDYAEKAIKIISDHEYRSNLEKGALLHAAKFSWDKTAERTEKLMELILTENE